MTTVAWTNDPEIERIARRRAAARLGWIVHATVFALVNLFLLALATNAGRSFHVAGTLGWGFGLAMHGLAVLAYGGGFMEAMVRRERERLVARREPW